MSSKQSYPLASYTPVPVPAVSQFIVFFAIHIDRQFAFDELRSLCALYNLPAPEIDLPANSSLATLSFTPAVAPALVARAVSEASRIHSLMIPFAAARDMAALRSRAVEAMAAVFGEGGIDLDRPWPGVPHSISNSSSSSEGSRPPSLVDGSNSFRISVGAFGRKSSGIKAVGGWVELGTVLTGKVDLDNAELTYSLIEGYPLPNHHAPKREDSSSLPEALVFGLQLAKGTQAHAARFDLKKRPFIGTTSMAADWAYLMAVQGLVRPGSTVLDPYVGTGSIIISCAARGAIVFGADRDPRAINHSERVVNRDIVGEHGRYNFFAGRPLPGEPAIFSNFKHYGLPPCEVVRMDSAAPLWSPHARWDAIITDPPYGVRAGAKKVGIGRHRVERGTTEISGDRSTHVPGLVPYPLEEIFADLLGLAARHLTVGGRLVYWLPTIESEFDAAQDIPTHPCLEIVANAPQWLHGEPPTDFFRRLITMTKTREPLEGEKAFLPRFELSRRHEERVKEQQERAKERNDRL